jgi:transcriptional regulator with XRE-family HTH domain
MNKDSIGQRARKRREELRLTQKAVAAACGITQQAYERFEQGAVARPRYLAALADVLHVTASWLLDDGSEPPLPSYAFLKKKAVPRPPQVPIYNYFAKDEKGCAINLDKDKPLDWVTNVAGLENAGKSPAGLYIQGDGLGPCYRNGYTAFINREKFPAKDGDCVYEMEGRLYFGRYCKMDTTHYYFTSVCNRQKKAKAPRNKVKGVYPVFGIVLC